MEAKMRSANRRECSQFAGRGMRKIALAAAATAGISGVTRAVDVSVTWNPGSASWNAASNWSGGAVPNNGSPAGSEYLVFIDGGNATNSTVLLDINPTIKALSISAGDTLNIRNIQTLSVNGDGVTASIVNAGSIT